MKLDVLGKMLVEITESNRQSGNWLRTCNIISRVVAGNFLSRSLAPASKKSGSRAGLGRGASAKRAEEKESRQPVSSELWDWAPGSLIV